MIKRLRSRPKPAAYVISESVVPAGATDTVRVRACGVRNRHAQRTQTRVMMCAVVFVFIFAALAVRLAYVSFGGLTGPGARHFTMAAEGPRPEITDRNGVLLATDLPMIALEVAGREVWDARETARALASTLSGVDARALEEKLLRGRYVEVRSDLTPAERQAVFDLGLPGVRFASRVKRFYPQADLAAHIVGHEEPGKGGVMGLEKAANAWPAERAVRTSIDIRIQQILEDILASNLETFRAEAAWGGVMDVATGEIIALASLPDFDPNAPGAAPADYRRNRATYDRYELGSAFKTFTAAAALEDGVATEASTYDATGTFKVADRRIADFHGENRILTLSEVIQYSSNIGIARVAGDLGAKRQQAYLQKLGLLEPLPLEVAENRSPELPGQWGPVETATIAYGHGLSVTPLHLLSAFAAAVNGGVYRAPTFIAGGDVEARRVFSEETSAVMRRILRRVVTDGTAEYAEAEGYFPIGKTATADKPSAGGYDTSARIASFIGAIPGHAPRYAILISLDNPQATETTYGYATAGWNAAPAFARFAARAAPLLGVSPVNEAVALDAFVSGRVAPRQEARLGAPQDARLP
ncbi:MAG: peptidoglycan D,D-transpeptidase FtsI family protein [Hyphococcus sp.]